MPSQQGYLVIHYTEMILPAYLPPLLHLVLEPPNKVLSIEPQPRQQSKVIMQFVLALL